jgi:hypothetical protein
MKRPYQILTKAAITAVVFTAIPSFAAQVPRDAEPAMEVALKYVSPLAKTIALENELSLYDAPPEAPAAIKSVKPLNDGCVNASLAFSAGHLFGGFSYTPPAYPFVTFNIARLQGFLRVRGQWCFDGNFNFTGSGYVGLKQEVFVGLAWPRNSWYTVRGTPYRWRVKFGLKLYADLGTTPIAGQYTRTAYHNHYGRLVAAFEEDFGVSFHTPVLEIQKWITNIETGSGTWLDLPSRAPTNGEWVDNIQFDVSVFGGLKFTQQIAWECYDSDPATPEDREQFKTTSSAVGQAGVKVKVKLANYGEVEKSIFWSQASNGSGVTLDSNWHHQKVDPHTEKAFSASRTPVRDP